MQALLEEGELPAKRNRISTVKLLGAEMYIAYTGYTGEPVCFEIIGESAPIVRLWDTLLEKGAAPIGLGARDTLRLEAGLPLYGHEYGNGPDGRPIPILSCPASKFGVSFAAHKGQYIGRKSLMRQAEALAKFEQGDFEYPAGSVATNATDSALRIRNRPRGGYGLLPPGRRRICHQRNDGALLEDSKAGDGFCPDR